ncbi:hypothetical protein BG53_12870 [Paenibacillus darwinianus]|uniref:Uncharacterized protein n=1 Tax=Paenibacillus darwinianus TaxID=1380763 RepID=A0A9W5S2H6_9BACL|nr:hypothetical protein [Paenibacillus darwinianus]EXX89448.1 hypothetical protein CH50_01525 [Paenibacillus darwinianus]EXX90808.1 hypothetical protein BG53_12870 [Paenibacillus darwinianus]EXX90848.1 hypothetical protein BG52_12065 [Paenibacillus darwinianus]
MRKLVSLRHWKHVFVRIYRLLVSPRVRLADKLLYLVPVAVYWVMPDVMPLLPIDDIAVTMLAAELYTRYMERKYPQ